MEDTPQKQTGPRFRRPRVPRRVLLIIGWACVALGLVGVVVPGMPTTTFLIIAAWCFVRSSEAAYRWLLEHRVLGPYVRDYLSGQGMPMKSKAVALVMMWTACLVSALVFIPNRFGQAAVLACAVVGTYLMLVRVPTRAPEVHRASSADSAGDHVAERRSPGDRPQPADRASQ